MGNELIISFCADETLYALLFNATGQVWNGAAFEAPVDANWGDYDIPLTEAENTELYRGDMPAVAAGSYAFAVRLQAGGSPAVTDDTIGAGVIQWDGSAEVAMHEVDVNVAQISGDSTAADNLEAACDGDGYDIGGIDISELNGIVDDLMDAGRIDLLIDAIKAKTDNLPASPAAVGSEMTLEDNAITAAKIAANAIGASEIASSAIDDDALASDTDTYQAKVVIVQDSATGDDTYMVAFFQNSEPVSGAASVQIQVVKASDGTDLVALDNMSQIGATDWYKYVESTNNIEYGAGYVIEVTATIGGSSRTWSQPWGINK